MDRLDGYVQHPKVRGRTLFFGGKDNSGELSSVCGQPATAMKIMHVAPYYHPSVGGGELHLKALSERRVQRGHRVTVLTQRQTPFGQPVDHTLSTSEVINGVLVRRFAPYLSVAHLMERLAKLPGGYRLLRALPGMARLANLPDGFILGAILAALCARPDLVLVENWSRPGLVWQFALWRPLGRYKLVGMPLFILSTAGAMIRPWLG